MRNCGKRWRVLVAGFRLGTARKKREPSPAPRHENCKTSWFWGCELFAHFTIDAPTYRKLSRRMSGANALEAIQTFVATLQPLQRPFVRVYSNGAFISNPPNLSNSSIEALSSAGSTLVLKQVDLFDRDMQEACSLLASDYGAPVHANIYYTPAGTKGFNAHFDYHDTVLWQFGGAKRWNLWPPGLPFEDRVNLSSVIEEARRLRKRATLLLKTGYALRIPAGLIHCATSTKAGSVHVTFGIYESSFCFFWFEVLAQLAAGDGRQRKLAESLVKILSEKTAGRSVFPRRTAMELDNALTSQLRRYFRQKA